MAIDVLEVAGSPGAELSRFTTKKTTSYSKSCQVNYIMFILIQDSACFIDAEVLTVHDDHSFVER
jgi:hypothetical protein